ncbi:MAG: hypothetical protein Q8M94_21545 [Ignavibacteria bacterium]|nr:hypothetical protein [Ignavibacteria bacterium]
MDCSTCIHRELQQIITREKYTYTYSGDIPCHHCVRSPFNIDAYKPREEEGK